VDQLSRKQFVHFSFDYTRICATFESSCGGHLRLLATWSHAAIFFGESMMLILTNP